VFIIQFTDKMIVFELNCSAVPLGPSQLLLRGAILKNTRWVFGMLTL